MHPVVSPYEQKRQMKAFITELQALAFSLEKLPELTFYQEQERFGVQNFYTQSIFVPPKVGARDMSALYFLICYPSYTPHTQDIILSLKGNNNIIGMWPLFHLEDLQSQIEVPKTTVWWKNK